MTRILSSNESQAILRSCLFVMQGRNAPCIGAQTTKPFELPPSISCCDFLQRCKMSVHALCPLDPIGTVPDTPQRTSMFSHPLSRPMRLGRARTLVARVHRAHCDAVLSSHAHRGRFPSRVGHVASIRIACIPCHRSTPWMALSPFPRRFPWVRSSNAAQDTRYFSFVRSFHRRLLGYLPLFACTTCIGRPSLFHVVLGPSRLGWVSSPPSGPGRGGHQPQERTHERSSILVWWLWRWKDTCATPPTRRDGHHHHHHFRHHAQCSRCIGSVLQEIEKKVRGYTHTSSERRTTPRGTGKPRRNIHDAKQACCCYVMQPARETKGVRRWEPKTETMLAGKSTDPCPWPNGPQKCCGW